MEKETWTFDLWVRVKIWVGRDHGEILEVPLSLKDPSPFSHWPLLPHTVSFLWLRAVPQERRSNPSWTAVAVHGCFSRGGGTSNHNSYETGLKVPTSRRQNWASGKAHIIASAEYQQQPMLVFTTFFPNLTRWRGSKLLPLRKDRINHVTIKSSRMV